LKFGNSSIIFLVVNPDQIIPSVLCALLGNATSEAASKRLSLFSHH